MRKQYEQCVNSDFSPKKAKTREKKKKKKEKKKEKNAEHRT